MINVIRIVEEGKIRSQNLRTFAMGLTSTLTYEQWEQTLKHFNYSCAYCGGLYNVVEHFIPVERGGGTCQSNGGLSTLWI